MSFYQSFFSSSSFEFRTLTQYSCIVYKEDRLSSTLTQLKRSLKVEKFMRDNLECLELKPMYMYHMSHAQILIPRLKNVCLWAIPLDKKGKNVII